MTEKQELSSLYGEMQRDQVFVDDGTIKHRAEMLKAMDLIVRNVSNEDICYLYWLQCGVPDGTYEQNNYEEYCDDDNYNDMVHAFKYCMKLALKDM